MDTYICNQCDYKFNSRTGIAVVYDKEKDILITEIQCPRCYSGDVSIIETLNYKRD